MESHHRNISGFVANLGGEKKRKSWYDCPGYVESMAGLIKEQLDSFTDEERAVLGTRGAAKLHRERGPVPGADRGVRRGHLKELPEGVKVHFRHPPPFHSSLLVPVSRPLLHTYLSHRHSTCSRRYASA